MTLLFFLLGTVILLYKYNERKGAGCLLFLVHLTYLPVVLAIFNFFYEMKPLAGFIMLPVLFIITIIFNLSVKESFPEKAAGIIGVVTGEIIPSVLLIYWMIFNISFNYTQRTYTDFTPENTNAVLSDMYIKDNGTFKLTSITACNDYFSLRIDTDTPPEVFINELMDKEYYDTEAIYEYVETEFERDVERSGFGVSNPDGTPFDDVSATIYLPDYLKDKENNNLNNITLGSVRILFDSKNGKCSIGADGRHLVHFSEKASEMVRSKKDTFRKKLDIVLKDGG